MIARFLFLIMAACLTLTLFLPKQVCPGAQPDANNDEEFSKYLENYLSPVLTVQKALEKGAKAPVLVDVRPSIDFGNLRIPASLNIPSHAIKTKSFLKSESLVLLNAGNDYRRLKDLAEELIKFGFSSVSILKGGLNGWMQSGGALTGNIFERKKIRAIRPVILYKDRNLPGVYVIEIEDSNVPASEPVFPGKNYRLSFSGDVSELFENIQRIIPENEKTNILYAVLLAEDPDVINRLNTPYIDCPFPVFFLEGGMKRYQAFLENQKKMWNPRTVNTKGNVCGSCD